MFNTFSFINSLLHTASVVSAVAPQISAESHKAATMDLIGVGLADLINTGALGTGRANQYATLGMGVYSIVMAIANRNGIIAQAANPPAPIQVLTEPPAELNLATARSAASGINMDAFQRA